MKKASQLLRSFRQIYLERVLRPKEKYVRQVKGVGRREVGKNRGFFSRCDAMI